MKLKKNIILTLLSCSYFFTLQAYSAEYEVIPNTLQAGGLLNKELLSGANYQVLDRVENDGLINTYTVKTDYGNFEVESTIMLLKRITELNALVEMQELENTALFTDALKNAGKSPFKFVETVIDEPVETVKKVGTGIGRWFGDVKRAATSNDPHQPDVLSTSLGQAPVKRQFAYEFNVDPYTSFKPLNDKLNKLAWVTASGGISVRAAFSMVGGNLGSALAISGTADGLKALVRDKTPEELNLLIKEQLALLEVPSEAADRFISNNAYNPQEKVLLVGELVSLEDIAGRHLVIDAANTADTEEVALYNRIRTQLMGKYIKKHKINKIIDVSGVPFMQGNDGMYTSIFPMDHVLWTGLVEQRLTEMMTVLRKIKANDAQILVLGSLSKKARAELIDAGWKVQDRLIDTFNYVEHTKS